MRGTALLILLGLSGCWPRIPGQYSDYAESDTDTDTDTDEALSCPGDDVYEENDDQSTAEPISPPLSLDAIACSEDLDFYSFVPDPGCRIDVHVWFTHADGDIDAQLFEGETVVVLGQSTDDDEEMVWFAEGSFQYLLAVYGYDGAENTYTLDVDLSCD